MQAGTSGKKSKIASHHIRIQKYNAMKFWCKQLIAIGMF